MKGHVCALLIQHEKYGHKGNLKRIKKTLPLYYKSRIKNELKKIINSWFSSLVTEIKGCIAGKKYYKQHQNIEQEGCLNFPQDLYDDVIVDENTLVSVVIPCYNQAHFL